MMVIELRKAYQDKIYELFEEIEELGHKKKALMKELKDMLHECFESSEEEYEGFRDGEYDDDKEMDYRRYRSYRSGMRHMRDDDDDRDMDLHYRRGMRRTRRAA